MIRNVLHTLGSFRSALAVGVGLPFLIAASAYAQDPAPSPNVPNAPVQSEATTERVVVTGSYIPTAETESALPVTVYTAEVLKKQGANTPVEGLRQLPSFVGNTNTENDSNGGDGSASISLRGLGPENTLTLINGRRAFLQVAGVTFTNINAIPLGAISRVEVLKDGASSVYGSDAVSGVVNFILLNGPGEAPYVGAELDMLYGNTTDSDANVRQIYLRGGVTGLDGKVSIAAAAEYYKRAELSTRDREIAVEADRRFLGGNNQGSGTFAGRVQIRRFPAGNGPGATPTTPNFAAQNQVLINLSENAPAPPQPRPDGSLQSPSYRAFIAGNDDSAFNFRIFTPSIPAQEKYQYYITGRYKIFGDGLQLYGDLLYAKNKQDNGLAAAPFALGVSSVNTSPFNPFLTGPAGGAPTATTTDDQLRSVSYRSVQELGNRKSYFDYDFWRYTVGFNGDFNVKDSDFVSNWGYDVGYVFHRTDQLRLDSGDAQFTPLEASLRGQGPDGSFFNPFVGQSAPVVGVAPTYTNGVQTGTLAYDNVAALQAAGYLGRSFFYNRSYLYDVKTYANLFPGLYQGGIGITLGYEHREQREHSIPDPVQAAGDQLGFNAAPLTKYYQEVDSYFGELRLPLIISTQKIPFAHSLEVAFAYRYEEFNNKDQFFKSTASFDNSGTPRISIRYQPIPDITLRASWGQSFQSPFAFQLFDPAAQNFPVLFDVSQGNTLQPPGGVFQAGALDLQPEETDSYSAGMVITPKWLPGFTATIDVYQVYTKSVIVGAADFAQILLSLNNADPTGQAFLDPDGPGLGIFPDEDGVIGGTALGVTRDDTGALFAIDSQTANAGKRLVNGLDVVVAYQLPWTNFGQITISGGYNYFFTWKAEALPGAGFTNFLGDYNNSTLPLAPGAIPYHKAFLRGEHQWKGFDFIATMNYISSFNDDGAFVLAARPIGGTGAQPAYPFYRRVSDYITLDLQLSYEFKRPEVEPAPYVKESKDSKNVVQTEAATSSIWQRMLWGTTIRVGCNNVFDRNPPTVLGAFNDNYDTSLYSIRNRFYYVGLNKKF